MAREHRAGWRWSNVPIPEPHVAGLFVGTVIHVLKRSRMIEDQQRARALGLGLSATGLVIIGWAVRTIGEMDVEKPRALVTTGPYAFSRNPMYVGWTALYLGVALVLNTLWLFVLLPVVVATSHRIVRQEEREYGDVYRTYRRDVRRYL